jgi:hypothetical protein
MNDKMASLFLFFGGLLLASFQTLDVDIGFHIKTGEYIVTHGLIPATNTFSFVEAAHPWPLHQWLPDIFLFLLWKIGGIQLVILAKGVIVGIIATVWYRILREVSNCGVLTSLIVVTLLLVTLRIRFFERPDLLSGLFFSLTILFTLSPSRAGRGWQCLNLLMLALWVNVHAGVVYGIIFHGPIWIERALRFVANKKEQAKVQWRRVAFVPFAYLAGLFFAQMVHPPAIEGLLLPFRFFDGINDYYIAELRPMMFSTRPWVFSFTILVILTLLVRIRRFSEWNQLVVCIGFAYLGLRTERTISFGLPLLTAFALRNVNWSWVESVSILRHKRVPISPGRLAVLLCTAALAVTVWLERVSYAPGLGFHRHFYPMPIFNLIKQHDWKGNLMNEMRFGGPLLLLTDREKVFVDGRLEAYSREFWLGYYTPMFSAAPGWEKRMEKFDIRLILLDNPLLYPNSRKFAEELHASTRWHLIAWTESTLLFARSDALENNQIDKMSFRTIWPIRIPRQNDVLPWKELNTEARRMLEMDPESKLAWGFFSISRNQNRNFSSEPSGVLK